MSWEKDTTSPPSQVISQWEMESRVASKVTSKVVGAKITNFS